MTTAAMNMLELGLAYARAGLSVVPVNWQTKQPDWTILPKDPTTGKAVWKPYQDQPATEEQIDRWAASGILAWAAVGGTVSGGLLALDFDDPAFYDRWLADIGILAESLPTQQTGKGFQVWLRCDQPGRNDKFAWTADASEYTGRRVAIESRGEGGYAVLPGSKHPSGRIYKAIAGDFLAIPKIPQADVETLIQSARSQDEMPYTRQELEWASKATVKTRPPLNGQTSVIDTYNSRVSIHEALAGAGYTQCGDRYIRPGGKSPSVVVFDDLTSYHFSSNDPLNDTHVHDAFDVYCYYNHGGDCSAGVKDAAKDLGLTARPPASTVDNSEGRPEVLLPGGSVSISETAEKLGSLLAETGSIYMRGGAVVTVEYDDDGAPTLGPIKPASLPSLFESVARLMKWKPLPDGDRVMVPTTCSEQQAKLILHAKPFIDALPQIKVVSRCPVLTEQDGHLVEVVGYDIRSGILAAGQPAQDVPLDTAKQLLYEALADFNFVTDADRARALAEIITPALVFGGLLRGRAPIDLGEADNSQSGKGFRNRATTAIYRHVPKTITQKKTGVGSLEESFNTALIRGNTFISFDNVRGKVDSPAVESFLTEPTYSARSPYMADVEIDPSRVVMMFTSNSAEITRDLSNRCCAIRIRKQPVGYEFAKYPEGDILDHIRENQTVYLGAVFAVIRAWHAAGKPKSQESRHDFRVWVQTLDWICQQLLGTGPIMDGHRETQLRMTNPALTWMRDVALAVVRAGENDRWLRAHNLLHLLLRQSDVAIPGMRDDADLDDDSTRNRALQAIGRRIGKCFEYDTLTLDGIQIDRHDGHDDQYRPIKEYLFTRQDNCQNAENQAKGLNPAIPAMPRNTFEQDLPIQAATPEFCGMGTIGGYSGVGGLRHKESSI